MAMVKYPGRQRRHQIIGNRIEGARFENSIEWQCNIQNVLFIKIPLGARRVPMRAGGLRGLIAVKTPFDYVLVQNGKVCFIDCKTFDQSTISYSMLTTHQVLALNKVDDYGGRAGYLVWHRDVNKVCFYGAKLLFGLKKRQSLDISFGLELGYGESFVLSKLFE